MSKFKLAKAKPSTPTPQVRGLPCVIMVCLIVVGVFVLIFLAMKYAS